MIKLVHAFCLTVPLLAACTGEPTGHMLGSHEDMVLEAIPYDLVGTTRLFFVRGDFTTKEDRWGTVEVDGSTRTSDITYPPAPFGFQADATSGSVRVSPDNRMLVYVARIPYATGERTSDIFVRTWGASMGTQLEAPTPGTARYQPSWSPDGTRVIFGELDGWYGAATRIISQSLVPGAPDRQLLWSAANACESAAGPRQNAAGDVAFIMHWLTAACARYASIATRSPGAPHRNLYVTDAAHIISLEWSPSGAEIAFVELPGDAPNGTFRIKVMAADGSNIRTVTTVNSGSGGPGDGEATLCWARDASRLFFDLPGAGESLTHIYTVAVTGGAVTPVTTTHNVIDRSLSCG